MSSTISGLIVKSRLSSGSATPERHNRETVEQSAAACDKPESVMPPGHPRIVERFEDG